MPGGFSDTWSGTTWQNRVEDDQGVHKQFGGKQSRDTTPGRIGKFLGDKEQHSNAQIVRASDNDKDAGGRAQFDVSGESGSFNRDEFRKIFSDKRYGDATASGEVDAQRSGAHGRDPRARGRPQGPAQREDPGREDADLQRAREGERRPDARRPGRDEQQGLGPGAQGRRELPGPGRPSGAQPAAQGLGRRPEGQAAQGQRGDPADGRGAGQDEEAARRGGGQQEVHGPPGRAPQAAARPDRRARRRVPRRPPERPGAGDAPARRRGRGVAEGRSGVHEAPEPGQCLGGRDRRTYARRSGRRRRRWAT